MLTYIVAIHLIVEAGAQNPCAEIARQLDSILGDTQKPSQGSPRWTGPLPERILPHRSCRSH